MTSVCKYLRWQSKWVTKQARLAYLHTEILNNLMGNVQHCSCFQQEKKLYECPCMLDYYDMDHIFNFNIEYNKTSSS